MGRLSPLRPLAENIWVAERPQTFYGLPVGTRMTVVRLPGERLLLHSPVTLDSELRAELDSIGRVSYAVAPNRVHHLYAGEVAKVYPEARLWVAPGLERKRPDLAFVAVLGDEPPEEWRKEVRQAFFRGRPYENEVVFFHRTSRTLVLCDLAFNFGRGAAAPTRLLMKLLRSYGRFGPSKLDPLLIRDREAARQSLERILAWDFDRVVVAHGEVLESGGLGIVIVTDLSLMGWLLGNFRSAEWPLIAGDILALIAVSWGCYALHTRIESAIAKLEEL